MMTLNEQIRQLCDSNAAIESIPEMLLERGYSAKEIEDAVREEVVAAAKAFLDSMDA